MDPTEGRERTEQRNCLGQLGRGRGPSRDGEEKARRQGCVSHSSRGIAHIARSVNGAHGGSKCTASTPTRGSPAYKGPFSFHPCCKAKPKMAWALRGKKKSHPALRLTWPKQRPPPLLAATSLRNKQRNSSVT